MNICSPLVVVPGIELRIPITCGCLAVLQTSTVDQRCRDWKIVWPGAEVASAAPGAQRSAASNTEPAYFERFVTLGTINQASVLIRDHVQTWESCYRVTRSRCLRGCRFLKPSPVMISRASLKLRCRGRLSR